MMAFINSLLIHWQALPNQRQRLQYAYLTVATIVIVVAGVVAFFRPDIGQVMAGAGLLLVATYVLNGISWGLLRAFVDPYAKQLAKSAQPAKRKPKK